MFKRANCTTDIEFVYTLAHELRHYYQNIESEYYDMICEICPREGNEKINEFDTPVGIDADLFAMKLVKSLFPDTYMKHIQDKIDNSVSAESKKFKMLVEYGFDLRYDLESEAKRFIVSHLC